MRLPRRRYGFGLTRPHARILLALLAIFLQAFTVQTHVHAFGLTSLASYEQSAGETVPDDIHLSAPREHKSCVLCQALTSGRSALRLATDVGAPRHDIAEPTTLSIDQAPQEAAHAWRSRAPPIVL